MYSRPITPDNRCVNVFDLWVQTAW